MNKTDFKFHTKDQTVLIQTHCFEFLREQKLFMKPDYCAVLDLALPEPLKISHTHKLPCPYLMIDYAEGITIKQYEQRQSCDKCPV